jgi:hypothetical protein
LRYYELENINNLILRYMNTGAGRYEEWSEEWLHDDEVFSSYTIETDCGEGLTWRALAGPTKEVESWEKTRKKRVLDRQLCLG